MRSEDSGQWGFQALADGAHHNTFLTGMPSTAPGHCMLLSSTSSPPPLVHSAFYTWDRKFTAAFSRSPIAQIGSSLTTPTENQSHHRDFTTSSMSHLDVNMNCEAIYSSARCESSRCPRFTEDRSHEGQPLRPLLGNTGHGTGKSADFRGYLVICTRLLPSYAGLEVMLDIAENLRHCRPREKKPEMQVQQSQ
ncbi:hypothetical protein H920_15195 [Fukomys damarensis]|uniref:Uncharacterized protein n=1 Tax=Fukomys damarensis TaxID=885580 RepID=A0A091CZS4_FUKDA|nr:hypothetical protein H920_15195 [Fukomys damarensis]